MTKEDLRGIIIRCKTEQEARKCCDLADKLGWKWASGDTYNVHTYWTLGTYYNFYEGNRGYIEYFRDKNYIIRDSEWFLENFTPKQNILAYWIDGGTGTEKDIVKELKRKIGGKCTLSWYGKTDAKNDDIIYYVDTISKEINLFFKYGTIAKYIMATATEVKMPKKQILDDVEREYLSNIIKPFRDKIQSITLIPFEVSGTIKMYFTGKDKRYSFFLPEFENNKNMYKGMERNKEYTIKELGL